MNKIILPACFLVATLSFYGCNKLDQQPISTLPASSFWKTTEDAASGNAALYAGLQNVFGKTFTEWGDARSDNLTYGGTGENQVNVSLNGIDAVTASADWGNLYNTIQRANLAIKYLPNIYNNGKLTQTDFNNYMAQAYAIRGFMYFWAVRLWGDVPVRLTPYESLDSSQYLGRTNKDSVLNYVVIPDLNNALALVNPKLINNFFITTGSILSIQAEVAMWQKRYNDVINLTSQIATLPNHYSLVQDPTIYKNVFSVGTTAENIWTLDWHYQTDGANGLAAKLGSNGNTSNYYLDTSTTWYHRWTQNNSDIRRYLSYDTITYPYTSQPKQIWKFYPIDINTGKPINPTRAQCEAKLIFYRYADILLMQAEAYNAIGDTADALKNVRLIRSRSNAGAINVSYYNNLASQSDVLNVILDERQLELYCEGKRWFDLVRNNTFSNPMLTRIMDPLVQARQISLNLFPSGFSDTAKILWPISRSALTANPALVQNPSYSR